MLAQAAVANYNMREFDEAQQSFERLLQADPHRLENMDTYSNILYVKECKTALSYLAHIAVQNDKYRPETCCIIGNYYSLKGQHEKAVLYFRRALQLNRQYLSAWTLMGHEYVEMRNTPAAIEAYRHAVDIYERDYRAWYGLGQTYEILAMPFYSLYYYRKATTLRPYDARMWCAMAGCYELLKRPQEAIKCYVRAESLQDREGIALHKLAKLYQDLGNTHKAASYFAQNLQRRDEEEVGGGETVEALLFLATHCKTTDRLEEAEQYCNRLLDLPSGQEKEEARALLREIRAMQQHRSASG